MTNHAISICVKCKTTTVCKRISLVTGGGGGKTFSISYMLNSTNGVFNPYILIGTCPMQIIGTCPIADNSRVEPTIFFMEKNSLKLFSGHFYGQSFIQTVRGPGFQLFFC